MNKLLEMMLFTRIRFAGKVRKYTGEPYVNHLNEVAAIAMAAYGTEHNALIRMVGCIALGHDLIEDTDTTYEEISIGFGQKIADGIQALTDNETGNRQERKMKSALRLSQANEVVQTIKLADLISNTSSIVTHDPNFARVYLGEKQMILDVLTKGDRTLHGIATQQVRDGLNKLEEIARGQAA